MQIQQIHTTKHWGMGGRGGGGGNAEQQEGSGEMKVEAKQRRSLMLFMKKSNKKIKRQPHIHNLNSSGFPHRRGPKVQHSEEASQCHIPCQTIIHFFFF